MVSNSDEGGEEFVSHVLFVSLCTGHWDFRAGHNCLSLFKWVSLLRKKVGLPGTNKTPGRGLGSSSSGQVPAIQAGRSEFANQLM